MPSGGLEKRGRKMKSASFHSTWDVPKDRQGRAKQEKERALPADCLLPVLVYDAHGRRKRHCIKHLEARGWKWRRGGAGKWMRRQNEDLYPLLPNSLRSTNSEINTKYRDHQIACHNDPTLRLGKSAEIVASGRTIEGKKYISPKKNRKRNVKWWVRKEEPENEICKLPFTWDVPKDGQGRAKQEKETALPADCLIPVLVYDAHGRRKRLCIEHLEARGWKWKRGWCLGDGCGVI
ncbi:hypothetical protein CDAR_569251 [Caerostris darwini]|uniref:Uncharacterized protein n=1 Tax=Caerostris darwini TaxID=1538125 RepID=A0AAV4NN08_9ARAC|nr:hypothetical protein CDAR_569251 [Caerostris darwini]